MIKFFRHIRQKLLTENRFRKYLFYAIGEIVLVVLGILIALQINNWNEDRKLKIKETEILTEIVSDLGTNITELENLLYDEDWNISTTINSIKVIMDYIESDKRYNDSLSVHFNNSGHYAEVNLKTSGYESLSSIGMELIREPSLRSKLGQYYTSTILKPKIAYNDLRDDVYHYMLDYTRFDFKIVYPDAKNLENASVIPIDFGALKKKDDYLQSLKIYLDVNLYYKYELLNTLKETQTLLTDIKNYIDN